MNYVFAVVIAALASVVCFKFTRSLLGALLLGGEIHEPETTKVLEGDTNNAIDMMPALETREMNEE